MLRIWLILLIFLSPLALFAQESQDVIVFRPAASEEDPSQKRKLEVATTSFKTSDAYSIFLAYLATRDDDVSVCGSNKRCRKLAQEDFLPMRYFAEGRCNEIKHESWGEKEICNAIKTNACDAMVGWKSDFCSAIISGNKAALLRAGADRGFIQASGHKLTNEEAMGILAFYEGYKHYSSLPCERYFRDDPALCENLACQVLFNPDRGIFESLINDIAILTASRGEKDLEQACQAISNSKIKAHCLNPDLKDINDVW